MARTTQSGIEIDAAKLPKARGSADDLFAASGWAGVDPGDDDPWEEPRPKPAFVREDDGNFYGGGHPKWPWR